MKNEAFTRRSNDDGKRSRRPLTRGVVFGSVLAMIAGAACVSTPPRQAPLGAAPLVLRDGERVIADQAILVFDGSYSIDSARSFPVAKSLLESFVEGMPKGEYETAGVELGQSVFSFHPRQPFAGKELASAARAVPYLGGPTPLDAALDQAAAELLGSSGRAAVILFSDGVPTRGSTRESTLAAARALIAGHDGEVCIHTVRTGSDPSGDALLRDLAQLTDCGSTRRADQIRDVAALYDLERNVFVGPGVPPVAAAPIASDADRDGVLDAADACPGTPIGAKVNAKGCWVLSGVLFDFDRAEIRAEARGQLDEVARIVRANPNLELRLEAHTDSRGSDAYNLALSKRRAESVRKYLIGAGIAGGRLEAKGWGETKPIASNETEAGRQKNRRVELTPSPIAP